MVYRKIIVRGRVQGVFFRKSTKEKANSLDITGTVRNEPDGSVYIEAAGAGDNMQRFIEWCRQGPPAASVKQVLVEDMKSFDKESFSIER